LAATTPETGPIGLLWVIGIFFMNEQIYAFPSCTSWVTADLVSEQMEVLTEPQIDRGRGLHKMLFNPLFLL